MRIAFLIGALAWCAYTIMTYSYADMELSLRNFGEVEVIFQFTVTSLGVAIFSTILSILGFIKVKMKGGVLIGIFSILISLLIGFLGIVVLLDVGSQIHEISMILMGCGVVQVLFFGLLGGMYTPKK